MATTAHPTHSAQHHASKFTSKQRTIALVIVALAFVMDLLDTTIVNIAIPSIQTDLGASYATIQWLIAGYSLAFATLLIIGGRLGDIFGYKRMFMIGVGGFTIASLLCGLAWNSEVLIAARIFQGGMAALMVPQVMSMMQVMYKPEERGGVMGIFGALAGIAASLGPVIGGLLIHFNIAGLDWRPIFLINVPVGIFAFFAGRKFLPEGKSPHPLRLDLIGTVIIMATLFLLVFPLIQGRELDWPIWIFVMMAVALIGFGLFALWLVKKDRKDHSALIPPVLFKTKTFVTGITINLIFQGAMAGFFLPFTLLLQVGLGYEVIKAALTGIPTAVGISLAIGFFGQKLIPRLGRYSMSVGTVVMAIGFGILYATIRHYGLDVSPWAFIPGLLVIGTGMGLTMAPLFSVVLTDVDHKHAGAASGVLNAVQQLGGAIGVALIGVFFFGHLSNHAAASFDSVASTIRSDPTVAQLPASAQATIIESAKTCFIDRNEQKDTSNTPKSCTALTKSGQETPGMEKIGQTIQQAVKKANTDNFIDAFRIGVIYELVLIAATFGLSFLLPRHIRPGSPDML